MEKRLIIFLMIVVLIVSSCTLMVSRPENDYNQQEPQNNQPQDRSPVVSEQTQNLTQQTTNQVKEFRVIISHTGYNPNVFTVKMGDTIKFLATAAPGTGFHNHGITIDEYGINQAVTSETNPITIQFVANKVGTFSIWCKTCWDGPFGRGHPDIRATLVVEA